MQGTNIDKSIWEARLIPSQFVHDAEFIRLVVIANRSEHTIEGREDAH